MRRLLAAVRARGRGGEAVVQAAKAALAGVIALVVAIAIGGAQPFLGPYAAVLAVTSTVRGSWSGAARQALMLTVGVLLAYAVDLLVPAPTAALAVVVVVGLLLGKWHRFGGDREWIAITAVILVANGAAQRPVDLAYWVVLSIVGSAVGATVNTLVLPPLHLRDAHVTVQALTGETSEQLRTMADGLRSGWSAPDAARWLAAARGLRSAVRRADDAVWFGRETVRWNLRRRTLRHVDVRLADPGAVHRMERLSERVVQVGVLLGDLAEIAEQQPDPPLADALERLASAVDATAARARNGDEVDDAVARSAELRDVDPAHVRSTCFVTVSDALADLTRRI